MLGPSIHMQTLVLLCETSKANEGREHIVLAPPSTRSLRRSRLSRITLGIPACRLVWMMEEAGNGLSVEHKGESEKVGHSQVWGGEDEQGNVARKT